MASGGTNEMNTNLEDFFPQKKTGEFQPSADIVSNAWADISRVF